MMAESMASQELRKIAGALSAFWKGGDGPSRSAIERAFATAGHSGAGLENGTKAELVRNAISHADDPVARAMIEELVSELQIAQAFEATKSADVNVLRRVLEAAGHTLSEGGSIIWDSGPRIPVQPTPEPPRVAPEDPAAAPDTTGVSSRAASGGARATLFIGSTVEALEVARAVHVELDHDDLDVTTWNHGLFSAGETTWSRLTSSIVKSFDFALFIFSGDDVVSSRDQQSLAIRDNVLIEYGLFVGVLGAERTFFLYNRDHKPKLASDLGGVTALTYRDRADNNLRAAVSPACDDIRKRVTQLGKLSRSNP